MSLCAGLLALLCVQQSNAQHVVEIFTPNLPDAVPSSFHPLALSDDREDPPFALDVSLFWIPVMTASADQDENEPGAGILFEADLRSDSGWGIRVTLPLPESGVPPKEEKDESSSGVPRAGLFYMTSDHEERNAVTHARTHSLYLELESTWSTEHEKRELFAYGGLSAGFGAAGFDFEDVYEDTGAAAAEARAVVGLTWRWFSLEATGGGYVWGYPGETIGRGFFLTVAVVLRWTTPYDPTN